MAKTSGGGSSRGSNKRGRQEDSGCEEFILRRSQRRSMKTLGGDATGAEAQNLGSTSVNGPIIAQVKCNGSLLNVHNGPKGYFLMTNGQRRLPRRPQWRKSTYPNHIWFDIENCDVPRDLEPELVYERIKRGLAERNYTGPVTITAIFAKTTEHIPLDMVSKLSANNITPRDLRLYNATKEELRDAADNRIVKEIEKFMENQENRRCNVMVLSGDHIFLQPFKKLKEQGYRTLAAFRPDTVSNEKELNARVWDSWVWRHLLDLPWKVGKKLNQEQNRKRKRRSGSVVVHHYSDVTSLKKLPALIIFLKQHPNQKIVVFFSTCASVEYHAAMMRALDDPLSCSKIHGNLLLNGNLQAFSDFKSSEGGHVLLCSDAVSLGHHIPGVDWIVRFNEPLNIGHYLYTSSQRREVSELLLLDGTQILGDPAFERYKVTVEEIKFKNKELKKIQLQVKNKNNRNLELRTLASEADISF